MKMFWYMVWSGCVFIPSPRSNVCFQIYCTEMRHEVSIQ